MLAGFCAVTAVGYHQFWAYDDLGAPGKSKECQQHRLPLELLGELPSRLAQHQDTSLPQELIRSAHQHGAGSRRCWL